MDDIAPRRVAPVRQADRAARRRGLALAFALVALAGWVDAVVAAAAAASGLAIFAGLTGRRKAK